MVNINNENLLQSLCGVFEFKQQNNLQDKLWKNK